MSLISKQYMSVIVNASTNILVEKGKDTKQIFIYWSCI